MKVETDARAVERKILRCPIKVIAKGGAMFQGRALDISTQGMSAMLTEPFDGPPQCVLVFDAFLANGKMVNVSVGAEAVYSICVGTTGFRVGFKIDQKNETAVKAIRLLLQ